MGRKEFRIEDQHIKEIIDFDILYRVNAKKNGETSVLLDRANSFLEPHFRDLCHRGLLEISDRDAYALSQQGKAQLTQYGVMFQCFKDLSIFKCVRPDADAPSPHEPDDRFGAYSEHANPPESEDYRLLIFENFCHRENRAAPLHLFVFFSLVENMRPQQSDDDWIWGLESGELASKIQNIVQSQPSAEEICPEGLTPDQLVDAIYEAGIEELKRCAKMDQNKYNLNDVQQDQADFWQETVITEEVTESSPHHQEFYHDPYPEWDNRVSMGSALCVGAFAGLATCVLLS